MSEKTVQILLTIIGVIFLAFLAMLLWFMLVVNHQRDLARDQFYAEHCKSVTASKQLFGGAVYDCTKEN